jgi:serine protease Do
MAGIGRKVALKVWRGGKSSSVTLTLAEYPSDDEKVAAARPDEGSGLGLVVADITPALQRELELEQAAGVAVKSVDAGSPAAKAGLTPGDVILAVAGRPVTRARDLKQAIDKLAPGELIPLQVMRGGARRFVALKKPAK